ncbi:hypothetical protein BGZ83_007636 [Gryganskiella cystojenkinii]|nr:hypothetical protein BGZ83_007636 [Gryganskiella cystojenkinii]
MDRALAMPELVHLIALYLHPVHHLVNALLVCKSWHHLWSPYLWHTLILHPTRPPLPSLLTPAVKNSPDQQYMTPLSPQVLAQQGRHVVQLRAPWLTLEELLALSTYCLHLQDLNLAHFSAPNNSFAPMLVQWKNLRILTLEVADNQEEIYKDDNTSKTNTNKEEQQGRESLLRTIAHYASPSLESVELTFQTSVKLTLDLLFALLKNCRSLKTLKLTDADIVDSPMVRDNRKPSGKVHYRLRKGHRVNKQDNKGDGSLSSTDSDSTLSPPSRTERSATLETNGCNHNNKPELATILTVETFDLRCLSISSSYVSDSILETLLARCPRLECIQLHSCVQVTDRTLETLAKLKSLRRLSFSASNRLTSQGLIRLFQEIKDLTHVHLCDLALIRDDCLQVLAQQHGHSLEKLAVYFSALLTETGIIAVLARCKTLRVLGFQVYGSSTRLFKVPWASGRTLEHLDLQGVFKLAVVPLPTCQHGDGGGGIEGAVVGVSETAPFLTGRVSSADEVKIYGFSLMKKLLVTLPRLRNLSVYAKGIERLVMEGLGPDQEIELLHFYGLQSAGGRSMDNEMGPIPWKDLRRGFPRLQRFACGAFGENRTRIKDELAKVQIEFQPTSALPNMAFEADF